MQRWSSAMNINLGGIVLPPAFSSQPTRVTDAPALSVPAQRAAVPVPAGTEADEPQTTPPSAMQRKIMEILQAQAEALETRDIEGPRGTPADRWAFSMAMTSPAA